MDGLPSPDSWHAVPGLSPSTMDHSMRLSRRLVMYLGIATTLAAAHAHCGSSLLSILSCLLRKGAR